VDERGRIWIRDPVIDSRPARERREQGLLAGAIIQTEQSDQMLSLNSISLIGLIASTFVR
jgi:hypothetical protein